MADTMPYTLQALQNLLEEASGQFVAHHHGFVLHSHFQPIYSFAHRRVVGHEGLMRAWHENGKAISPYTVFASAKSEQELVHWTGYRACCMAAISAISPARPMRHRNGYSSMPNRMRLPTPGSTGVSFPSCCPH